MKTGLSCSKFLVPWKNAWNETGELRLRKKKRIEWRCHDEWSEGREDWQIILSYYTVSHQSRLWMGGKERNWGALARPQPPEQLRLGILYEYCNTTVQHAVQLWTR